MASGVLSYLGGRLLGAIPMLFLMSLVVFAIVYMIPGDPVDAMAVIYMSVMLMLLLIALRFVNPTQLVTQIRDEDLD